MPPRLSTLCGTAAVLVSLGVLGYIAIFGNDGEPPSRQTKVPTVDRNDIPRGPPRTSLTGRWRLTSIVPEIEDAVELWAILEIRKGADGKLTGEVLDTNEQLKGVKVQALKAGEKSLAFQLGNGKVELRFAGQLTDGRVRGEWLTAGGINLPAWLEATHADTLEGKPEELEETRSLANAFEKDTFEAYDRWTTEHPDSPLGVLAFQQALNHAGELTPAAAESLAKKYVAFAGKWGLMLQTQAHLELGRAFVRHKPLHDLAGPHLEAIEKSIATEAMKSRAESARARLLLATGREKEGLALAAKFPYNPELSMAVAVHAEEAGDTDKAIDLYARIVATPLMAGRVPAKERRDRPMSRLERLWTAKHGSDKGLDELIRAKYEQAIQVVKPERSPPRKPGDGNRVALVELFTGQACPGCAGADVATILLEREFAQTEVIVLRYHQHIPAADPLANAEGQQRYGDYDGQNHGTPLLAVNGDTSLAIAGPMEAVKPGYEQLRAVVAEILTSRTDTAIDLSARANGSKIAISAKVTGLKNLPNVKLRLALAEESVPFEAENGIRSHEMLVRKMPGGIGGKNGRLEFTGEIDVNDLERTLREELKAVEEKEGSEFREKPLELKTFRVVAFVQDDSTKQVLQARSVKVAGPLDRSK